MTFNDPIDPGRLHPSDHTCQTECTSCCYVVVLLFSMKSDTIYKDAAWLEFECEVEIGCKLGAKCIQFAPNLTDFSSPNHPVSLLECMAGTTGLEPATSAVTAFQVFQRLTNPWGTP